MSDTPIQTEYYAGIRFDSTLRGSSPNYGQPTIKYQNTVYQAGTSIRVINGSTVEFRATPNSGFKLEYWKTPLGTAIQDPDGIQQITINGGDAYLYPCYSPINPTYSKMIYLTTRGFSGSSNVNVSSMNGYYDYSISSSFTENTVHFNGSDVTSVGNLPDGKTIGLMAKIEDGYTLVFRVNGSVVPTQIVYPSLTGIESSSDVGVGETGQDSPERGGTGSLTDSGRSNGGSRSEEAWAYAEIVPTSGNTRMDLYVDYVEETQSYTVSTQPNPRGCGSTTAAIEGLSPSSPSQNVTVDDGETVKIVATPAAGYSFSRWENISSGYQINTPEYTYQVHSNDNWTAIFTSSDTKITAKSETTSGGTVNVTDGINFNQTGTDVSISQSQTQSQVVTLTATANDDYTFQYWYNDDDEYFIQYDYRIQVGFGETDTTWIAKFLYTPQDIASFKAFTTIEGTNNQDAGQNVKFSMSYKNIDGERAEELVGRTAQYIESLIEADQTGAFTTIKFGDDSPHHVTEEGRTWRYDLTGYKYAIGYVSGFSHSQENLWYPIDLVDNEWKLYINTHSIDREQVFTVSGFYTRTETFRVETSISTPSGSTTEIAISGSGVYSVGDSVTVSTSTTNANTFRFECWYDTINEQVVSTEQEYTFTVNENTSLEARYSEYYQIQFSATPQNLGSVGCTQGSSVISNSDYVERGSDLTFTCIPSSGVSILNWLDGTIPIPNSSEVTDLHMSVYGNMNIRARLMETSKKLTVRSAGGGIVNVYLKDSGGTYNLAQPDDGTDYIYTIPNGGDVRIIAIPNPRYNFESFTLYDSNDSVVDTTTSTQLDIVRMTEDMSVNAVFSFIPWISTLGTIIKVY